jgi:hypothetical protein
MAVPSVVISLVFAALSASPSQLVAALGAGDADGLRQVARAIGAAGLAPAIAADQRSLARAAIQASEDAPDAAVLLPALRVRALSADRPLAAAAARAAARIATALDPIAAGEAELDRGWLLGESAAWRGLATDAARYADIRVAALEVAARLAQDAGEIGFELATVLADPEPELRRAALELLPLPLSASHVERVRAAMADGRPAVVGAASRALCAPPRSPGCPAPAGRR